jgi:hypothetical protein
MTITKNNRAVFLFLLVIIFLGSFLASMAFNIVWKDIKIVNEPLHSTFEAFGAMAAISMALLLFQLHHDGKREKGEYFLLAMGFLTMGILDGFHAGSFFGRGSVLLRGLASILGSVWFALVWLPGVGRYIEKMKSTPWIIASISILLGILIPWFREFFPLMVRDNRFTPFAVVLYVLSGLFLIVAAIYFFLEFLHSSKTESYLFTLMFLLSGLPAVQCSFSAFWSEDWWFWHVQRCLAYTVVFYYMFSAFLRVREELKQINQSLEQRIAARTAELSIEVAERKRYGAERDKVITDLQDAFSQIKTLTGLLPTCASCKKIKDNEGNWTQMESYIQARSQAKFSHGICPDCVKKLYPDMYEEIFKSSLATKRSIVEP